MGKVCHLAQRRRAIESSTRAIHFTRTELNKLLSLYSRRVARGEWRDYAIDQRPGTAAFSVFRHTHERPLYTITKRVSGPAQAVEYLVFRDYRRLTRTARLDEALGAIERPLKVVS